MYAPYETFDWDREEWEEQTLAATPENAMSRLEGAWNYLMEKGDWSESWYESTSQAVNVIVTSGRMLEAEYWWMEIAFDPLHDLDE